MTIPDLSILAAMCNGPDLLLLAFLVCNAVLGGSRGLIRTLLGVFGKAAVLIGAVLLSGACAPVVSTTLVKPILGDLFTYDLTAYLTALPVGTEIMQSVDSMCEGVAFSILFFVFAILLGMALHAVGSALSLACRVPPIGFVDHIGGAALGIISGAILALVALHLAYYFQPALFAPLGVLAPDVLANTVLVRRLLAIVPI